MVSFVRFLPRLAQQALEEEMEAIGVKKTSAVHTIEGMDEATTCEIKDGVLRIGGTTVSVHDAENKMKVPDVLFYENPQVRHIFFYVRSVVTQKIPGFQVSLVLVNDVNMCFVSLVSALSGDGRHAQGLPPRRTFTTGGKPGCRQKQDH